MIYKPVFVVGHARGGTTLLASLLLQGGEFGPRVNPWPGPLSIKRLANPAYHLWASDQMERKELLLDHFGGRDVFCNYGKELIKEDVVGLDKELFINALTAGLCHPRLLHKAPQNTFRIKALTQVFPDAKFVAVVRKGEEVISSWACRPYGFGANVSWGEAHSEDFDPSEAAFIFARKWLEGLDYLSGCLQTTTNLLTISHHDLIYRTDSTLFKVAEFLETFPIVDFHPSDIIPPQDWRKRVPEGCLDHLSQQLERGNDLISQITKL